MPGEDYEEEEEQMPLLQTSALKLTGMLYFTPYMRAPWIRKSNEPINDTIQAEFKGKKGYLLIWFFKGIK